MNNLTITGNLTNDMEIRFLNNETCIGEFTIANNEKFSGKEKTTFLRCKMFGEKRIDALEHYLLKGAKVLLTGTLNIDSVKDEDDNYRNYTSLVIDNLEIIKFVNTNEDEEEDDKKSKSKSNNKSNKNKGRR